MNLFTFQSLSLIAIFMLGLGCGEDTSSSQTPQDHSTTAQATSTPTSAGQGFTPWAMDTSKLITTPSGLRYQMVQQGTGNQVKATDKVVVMYHGMLTDGKVFDSSFERNQPADLSLDQVITGWREGLTLCKVGAKIIMVIPPNLGYGTSEMPNIPANSTVIFNVEVIGAN